MSVLTMKALQEQTDTLSKEVSLLREKLKVPAIKKSLNVGDTFELSRLTWKILDITEKGYMCLAERLNDSMDLLVKQLLEREE